MIMYGNPKELLRQYDLVPKKSWGQNFLISPQILERIVALLGANRDDLVVEFGAGTGALTALLCRDVDRVFAIERDRDLVALLEREFAASNLQVIAADAARFCLSQIDESGDLLVIGNLPYQITAPILFRLHEDRHLYRRAVLMVQKEVADRLVAQPGDGKDYSLLSILFGAFFIIKRSLAVSREHFHPKPKVDSVVVVLEPRAQALVPIVDELLFTRVVKATFAQRRKTLLNTLQHGFPELQRKLIEQILCDLNIAPQTRGEALTIAQFALLTEAILRTIQISTPQHQGS
jgi:16S rRNA (adenine1518-N6/adenine1519-N6)-dimethyltransferase